MMRTCLILLPPPLIWILSEATPKSTILIYALNDQMVLYKYIQSIRLYNVQMFINS